MSARGNALILRAELPGRVRGQGSLKLIRGVYGNEVATYDAAVRNYRNLLVAELRSVWGDAQPWAGPAGVEVGIKYPRPVAHYLPANRKRVEPELRPDAPAWHAGTPDCDKVARLVDDALVAAGVLLDDKQIAALSVWDRWGPAPGSLTVQVWRLSS